MIVRELLARLGMDVDESAFKKAENALGRFHLAFEGLKDIAREARHAMMELTGEVAENAERLEHAQRITGLSTDRLQELEYAAKRADISTESLQIGLVHLARSAQSAAQGGGDGVLAFQKLGVSFATSDGKVRPMNDLLSDVIAGIAKMPDGAEKAATAMQVFGRSGAQLIPLLDEGPKGLAELAEQAHALGVVMNTSALAAGQRYQASHERMTAAVQGLKNAIATQLFPALTKSTEQFIRMISVHRHWVALKVKEAFELISRAAGIVFRVVRGVVDLLDRAWKSGAVGKGVLITLGVAITALVAPWSLLAAAIALVAEDVELFFSSHGKAKTVTGLLVDAVGILRKKISNLFKEFREGWEAFKENPFSFLYDHAKAFFKWFVAEAADIPNKVKAALASDTGKSAVSGASNIGKSMQSASGSPLSFMLRLWGSQIDSVSGLLSSSPATSLSPMPAGMAGIMPGAPSISFGDIIVQGSDGRKAGEDFLRTVQPRLEELIEDRWNQRMRETAAAVSR